MKLTARQHEVLRGVAAGMGDKEIAARLGVSIRTVRTHLDLVTVASRSDCRRTVLRACAGSKSLRG